MAGVSSMNTVPLVPVAELVGRTAPFPYWPEADREALAARLDDELHGRTTPGGFQVRVKRKDGTLFDARLYVSPLIDAKGQIRYHHR